MTICSKYPKELAHYNQQLKKKSFWKLKNNVWECKTKWQLLVTADWTYRYRLLRFCFRHWAVFKERKQRKRSRLEEARNHYSRNIQYRAFGVLRRNIERSWSFLKYLRNILNLKLMRRAWMRWRKFARKSSRSREIELLTVRMRELHLLKSYVELWYLEYVKKKSYEKNYMKAVKYHNFSIKRRAIKAWTTYRNFRCIKRRLIAHILKQQELKVKGRVFRKIMGYAIQKKLYREHIQCVTLFYENYLLRNVIDKWYTRYEELIESRNRDKSRIAVHTYHVNLVMKSFRKLRLWSEQQTIRATATKMFMEVSVTLKITFYLEVWRKNLQERLFSKSMEEKAVKWRICQLTKIYLMKMVESFERRKEENVKVENFLKLCNDNIKVHVFDQWKCFIQARKMKKSKRKIAEDVYSNRITQQSFWGLKTYVARRRRKKDIIDHYEKRLMWKALTALRTFCQVKRFRRALVHEFRERNNRKNLRRSFSILKNLISHSNSKYQRASCMAGCKSKRKTFHMWRSYHEDKRKTKALWETNRFALQNILLCELISTWRRRTRDKLTFNEKLEKLKRNQEWRSVKKYFTKWLGFVEKVRRMRESCLVFCELHSDAVIRYYICEMRRVWHERRTAREKRDLALRVEREITLRRSFKMWIGYVRWKAEKLRACSAGVVSRIYSNTRKFRGCYGSAECRRRQPMIPLYLRQECLLSVNEDSLSSRQHSNGDTHDISNPVNENLPVIY